MRYHLNRRQLIANLVPVAAIAKITPARAADVAERDRWFWELVDAITARPATGGPHTGAIVNSRYGVEAHRAGRLNPGYVAPSLENFFLEVELFPSDDGVPWEVGIVWRVSAKQDALWWTITNDGTWNLDSGAWRFVVERQGTVAMDQFDTAVKTPVTLQALVAGSFLAVAINAGGVLRVALPPREGPGQVGILANCSENYLRASGQTPYKGLAVWSLDTADRIEI